MAWPRPQYGLEPRLNAASASASAVACLSKTQNAHFYYIALRDLQFSNFPSAENKVAPRPATRCGCPHHTNTYIRVWCTFDFQQFYLRISHIATVASGCKESEILAELPVNMQRVSGFDGISCSSFNAFVVFDLVFIFRFYLVFIVLLLFNLTSTSITKPNKNCTKKRKKNKSTYNRKRRKV